MVPYMNAMVELKESVINYSPFVLQHP
ncbi:hypothetical protein ACUODF_31550 [Escherichia coli]